MKLGMIFECGPDGADRKVCEYLAKQIKADIEIDSVTLDNKRKLVAGCGPAAARLLADGCERVIIIWDLHPAWRAAAPCRKEDRDNILQSLRVSDVDVNQVFLICIEEELEAWLLADNRALNEVLSKPHRKVNIKRIRSPERINNPKKRLTNIFYEYIKRPYTDRIHAEQIVRALPDLNRLYRIDSFHRFARKVEEIKQ